MCLFGTGLDASIQPLAYLEFGVGDLELGQFHRSGSPLGSHCRMVHAFTSADYGVAHSVRRTEPREDTCILHLLCDDVSPIDHLRTYMYVRSVK